MRIKAYVLELHNDMFKSDAHLLKLCNQKKKSILAIKKKPGAELKICFIDWKLFLNAYEINLPDEVKKVLHLALLKCFCASNYYSWAHLE